MAFEVVTPGKEGGLAHVAPEDAALSCARAKLDGAAIEGRHGLLVAVDTIVAQGGRSFGKPRDASEARSMLLALSGTPHEVLTAHAFAVVVAGLRSSDVWTTISRASVLLRAPIGDALEAYLAGRDWADKAGGYGIQSEAKTFVSLVAGSFDCVVGLDVAAVREALEVARSCPQRKSRLRCEGS